MELFVVQGPDVGRSFVVRRITEGRVAFENVSFRYPGASDSALERVSFKIEPGERVGPGAAVQHVAPVAADKRVGAASARHVLDVRVDVVGLAGLTVARNVVE